MEAAIDALTHHVFNSLRGHYDDLNGVTFEDVRAIVARNR
jgi:predicted phosphoribosyltransferase